MTKKHFVLKDVTDFAPGAFENTAIEAGGIQLGHGGGGYLPAGTYTSAAFTPPEFTRLIPSWNADTPPGTAVEVAARIASGGRWSRWFSFGRWSPFIDRASPDPVENEMARVEGELLTLAPGRAPADTAQLRVSLYTNDSGISPTVRLLALTTDGVPPFEEKPASGRVVEIPAYSCLVREPGITQRIAGATTLAMLMNRWGEDVLPEEVARGAYDAGTGRFANLSFLCALAGAYSYECHAAFADIAALRQEIWRGQAVAAKVRYRAPALGQPLAGEAEEQPKQLAGFDDDSIPAVLDGASVDSPGHLLVVRGFTIENETEHVVINDPLSPTDETARRIIPLSMFRDIYTGICVFLRKGPKGAGTAKPVRITGELQLKDNEIHLTAHDKPLADGDGSPYFRATVCYTLSDGVAYSSAAQKKFYYPRPDEEGKLRFDRAAAQGQKLTFYRIGPLGTTWVAEKQMDPAPETVDAPGGHT